MELFSIINEDFFKPLTSSYKKNYLDCIKRIYSVLASKFEVERRLIVENLQEYFEENSVEMYDEDNINLTNSKDKSSQIIRYLINCGWLESEIRNDHTVMLSFKDEAINFIKTILNIENEKEIEYNASMYTIFNNLNSLFTDNPCIQPYTLVICKTLEDTEELLYELKRLRNNIKRFIEKITADKTLSQIIENIIEFTNSNISDKFERLTTTDNISKYRTSILVNLKKLLEDRDLINKVVTEYQEINKISDYDLALEDILSEIYKIQDFFKYEYDQIINEITNKNLQYRKKALERAKFLHSGEAKSLVSHINYILKYLEDDDINEILEDNTIINIYCSNFIDDTSFCPIKINKTKTAPEKLQALEEISEETRQKNRDLIKKQQESMFTETNVSKYLNDFLKDSHKRRASEINFNTKEDALRLLYIKHSCRHKRIPFIVTEMNEKVIISNYKFTDFYIERV